VERTPFRLSGPGAHVLGAEGDEAERRRGEGFAREARHEAGDQGAQDLRQALAKNARARSTFEGFSPSHKREYVEWIEEAKRPQTRVRRLSTAMEWMAEGKSRPSHARRRG
jgi:uncharacterized protein YdeI (YjbR/CyaY-like superfamily)